MIDTLLNKIRNRRETTQRNRIASYLELVRVVGDGKEPDDDDIDRVLDESGKTVDQLATDVETYQRRVRWRDQLDSVETHEARLAEIAEELEAERDLFLKAEQRFNDIAQALGGEKQEIHSALTMANSAHRSLIETSLDETIEERQQALTVRRREVVPVLERFKTRKLTLQGKLKAASDRVSKLVSLEQRSGELSQGKASDLVQARETVSYCEDEIATLDGRLAELLEQHNSLEAKGEQLRELALIP